MKKIIIYIFTVITIISANGESQTEIPDVKVVLEDIAPTDQEEMFGRDKQEYETKRRREASQ